MSTDLTTTLILLNEDSGMAARFIRTPDGSLRVHVNDLPIVFPEEDAIMLRDWLNDEWPVMQEEPVEDECCQAGGLGGFFHPSGHVSLDDGVRYAKTPWGFVEVAG